MKTSPKAARQATLQILSSNKGNIAETAKILNTTRKTISKALKKKSKDNLDDLSNSFPYS